MVALVDADSLLYIVGFTFQDSTDWGDGEPVEVTADLQSAKMAIDGTIENIMFKTGCESVELWFSGSSNFRYEVFSNYKHNRKNSERPMIYNGLKDYLENKYECHTTDGYEADDMVVYLKNKLPEHYFLCAIDKDVLYQTEGTHYNYSSDDFINVRAEEALRFFYYQVLVGDSGDGYGGCKGVGAVKANKILNEASKLAKEANIPIEESYYNNTLIAYMHAFDCDEDIATEMVQTTARLASMTQLKYDDKSGEIVVDLWCFEKALE